MNIEIVEKIKRMVKTSTELKGLGLSVTELATIADNVGATIYGDIDDVIQVGESTMVQPLA